MPGGENIYDPAFVKGVFDRCGANYRIWSQIASFGFVWLWRRQAIRALPPVPSPNAVAVDVMAGTGETWSYLLQRHPQIERFVALDISSRMVERAVTRLHGMRSHRIEIIEANVLDDPLNGNRADVLVCTFGLKTFNLEQQRIIAGQVARLLKPGGVFSFIEASDPKDWVLVGFYRFYLGSVLPLIERFALRGAQDFSMIGSYSRAFGDCRHFAACLRAEGLHAVDRTYFFGCATGVTGRRF